MRIARVLAAVALTVVGAALLNAPAASAAPSANPGVIPPTARVGGKTYAEWSATWWQYALQAPTSTNALADTTGQNCALNQSGSVFFLVGANDSGTVNRTQCTVPTGKFLFFPLVNAFDANDPGKSRTVTELFDELESSSFGTASELHATVDGQPVTNLNPASTPFRVCAGPADKGCGPAFGLKLPADNIFGAPAGVYDPAVADGYYLMLAPLKPGPHVITFGGTVSTTPQPVTQDIRYELTVR